MPILDGPATAKKIKKLCTEKNFIMPKIIGHSALNSEFIQNEFDKNLEKPSTPETLENIISELLL